MKYKITGFKRSFGIIFTAVLAVTAGSVVYWQQVTQRLAVEARQSIVIVSRELAENFERLLGAELQVLTALSVSLEEPDVLKSKPQLITYLNRQNRRNSFEMTGVQFPNGEAVFSNGLTRKNFLSKDEVDTAYEHSHYVSSRRKDPFSQKNILVLAIPLRSNGEKLGLVFATQSVEFYEQALAASSMHGEGLSFILTKTGEVVISYPEVPFGNMFEFSQKAVFDRNLSNAQMKNDIASGKEGLTGYSVDGLHRFVSYRPLAYNGWYGLSVLPTQSMAEKAQELLLMSLILCLSIIAVLVVLLIFILRMQYQSSKALYQMGFVDPLTKTDNLNAFRLKFSKTAEDFKAKGVPVALALVNVNRFKAVNDIYGFEQGDQILKQVAEALQGGLEEGELFCRSGADVFLLLVACPNRDELGRRLDALLDRAGRFCRTEGECLPLSLTCGVYLIDEDVPFYLMMDRANLAWASAKQHAGKTCAFYDEAYRREIVNEKRIESSMEQAMLNGEFQLYLQPKCDFKTGITRSAEALVRWEHPEKGLIPPDSFIPVFERNGFVLKLDLFILEESLRLLKRWLEEEKPVVSIGVNFSRLHLEDPSFIDTLTDMADQYAVPHSLLEIELTESVVFGNIERMKQVIDGLHEKGFSVAMDDFGSGYSSLNVLKNLYFDCIKLDKEFLARGEGNPRMRQVISGAVKMIKGLGSSIVAEGVETREQADFLNRIGCDMAQGYLFSRPLPVAEFEKRLQDEIQK
ncbi:MAG: EAL domain-containing protein [Elusimicrobiaceae bacterium]|nr:EAL domain-containing protein [Elusimicrobiaceae bacterium]